MTKISYYIERDKKFRKILNIYVCIIITVKNFFFIYIIYKLIIYNILQNDQKSEIF